MALMALGLFVFEVPTVAYQAMSRSSQQRWASNNRVGRAPAYQYLGKGEESITFRGTLYPEFTGGMSNLDVLRQMADEGQAYTLMSGSGDLIGHYFIQSIDDEQSYFLNDGIAQKIDFTITLNRNDDDRVDQLGDIGMQIPQVTGTAITR